MQFAEFLNHSSPNHLSILYLSTWVGLGYGHRLTSLAAFLGSIESVTSDFRLRSGLSLNEERIYLRLGLHQIPGTTIAPVHLSSCVPALLAFTEWVGSWEPLNAAPHPLSNSASAWTVARWCWNINQLCIDYAFRPRLSSRLTLGGLALPRNPWTSGGGVSHPSFATHANILTRPRSTESYPSASVHDRRSATTYTSCINPQLRLCTWAPLHYPRRITRPVSYYALFQGWLLLSQPPGCTELGALVGGLGCFPLVHRSSSPEDSLLRFGSMAFGVWLGSVTLWGP